MVFAVISAVIILASAASAIVPLMEPVPMAHVVGGALTNVTREFQTQERIDEQSLARLQALEATVIWTGDRQEAMKTRILLQCDWEHKLKNVCVTPLEWNETQRNWTQIQSHLQGAFELTLQQNIHSLQSQL